MAETLFKNAEQKKPEYRVIDRAAMQAWAEELREFQNSISTGRCTITVEEIMDEIRGE